MSISDLDVESIAQPHADAIAKVKAHPRSAKPLAMARQGADEASTHEARSERPLQSAVPIVVLSADAALAESISAAVLGRGPVVVAADLDEAFDLCAAGRCGVLIIDEASSPSVLRTVTQRLRAVEPALVVIAVGCASDQHALMSLLSAGLVDRLMLKPLTPALAQIVLKSAAQQYRTLRKSTDGLAPADAPPAEGAPDEQEQTPRAVIAAPRVDELPQPTATQPLVAVESREHPPTAHAARWLTFTAALALVAVAVWWAMSLQTSRLDPNEVIERNLAAAQQALDEQRTVEPAGRSAVDFYHTVLAIDPSNATAKRALAAIAEGFMQDAERAMERGDVAAAVGALDAVQRVSAEHARMAALQARIIGAQQSGSRRESTEAASTAERAATVASVVPTQTAAPAPSAPSVASKREVASQPELPTRIMANAAAALERGKLDVAAALIEEARALGATDRAIASLEQRLTAARQVREKEDLLQLALRRVAEDRLLGADDSAKHYLQRLAQLDRNYPGLDQGVTALGARLTAEAKLATAEKRFEYAAALLDEARGIGFAGPDIETAQAHLASARVEQTSLQPSEPKLLKLVRPEYPEEALRRSLEGWVDVNLSVSRTGGVLDPAIAESSHRVFERPALAAVRKWKYEPLSTTDPNDTHPVTVRVIFQLREETGRAID